MTNQNLTKPLILLTILFVVFQVSQEFAKTFLGFTRICWNFSRFHKKLQQHIVIGILFSKPMFPLFVQLPDKKVLDPNGQNISKNRQK